MHTRLQKILIANRGEIAVRIMRTAHDLGYQTVGVYTDADADALHTKTADEAVRIGSAPVGSSYLAMRKLLDAAHKVGADAIHPGYGFLSENADFAEICSESGLNFIGPPADAIRLMGNKRLAKLAMMQAGVPCVPGYEGENQDPELLAEQAREIGFPVMIKAAAGGGGRGMRLIEREEDLAAGLQTARSEAEHGFGSGELILEKAIVEPRHVEIQVFADSHGNCIYLGERDCSIQRRHQKVVEEAPSPVVSDDLRKRMGGAAVEAAKACGYLGAGTVEFLLAPDGAFYFLEMNTRLQVEHPVTEMITGTDLVAWQIQIAEGAQLPLTQQQVELRGHAIEVRLYAEAPGEGFLPQTGTILEWMPAEGDGVRIDSGIQTGQPVTPYYDPILAKLVAWGPDRETARRRLVRALRNTTLLGVNSNAAFLQAVLEHPEFASGDATTAFINAHFSEHPTLSSYQPSTLELGLAALLLSVPAHSTSAPSSRVPLQMRLSFGDREQAVCLQQTDNELEWMIQSNEESLPLTLLAVDRGECVYRVDGVRKRCRYVCDATQLYMQTGNASTAFRNVTLPEAAVAGASGTGVLTAPMDGSLVEVLIQPGDTVSKGQTLAVLEAMKMEHPLIADVDGLVEEVRAAPGQQVRGKQVLVTIDPA